MRQRGFIPILILVGILVIAVAVSGAYYMGTRKPATVPSPTPVVTSSSPSDASPAPNGAGETANWKTYTNTKLGYEIKYPQDEETSTYTLDYINIIIMYTSLMVS